MKRFIIPLGIFALLLVFLGIGLTLKPQEIPSPFIDKPAPAFAPDRQAGFRPQDMQGKVWLLNVWASWCGPCRIEHPILIDLSKQGIAPIVGLNYMDGQEDGKKWLAQHGNPYQVSLTDTDGKIGTNYGVYGVPETFVIDKRGVIRLKLSGGLTPEVVKEKLIPLIQDLNRA